MHSGSGRWRMTRWIFKSGPCFHTDGETNWSKLRQFALHHMTYYLDVVMPPNSTTLAMRKSTLHLMMRQMVCAKSEGEGGGGRASEQVRAFKPPPTQPLRWKEQRPSLVCRGRWPYLTDPLEQVASPEKHAHKRTQRPTLLPRP